MSRGARFFAWLFWAFWVFWVVFAIAASVAHAARQPTWNERAGIEKGVTVYLKKHTQVKTVKFSHFAVSTVNRHFARVSLRSNVGYAVAALVEASDGPVWGNRWLVWDLGSAEVGCFGPPMVDYPVSVKNPDALYDRVFRDLLAPRLGFFCP